MPTFNLSTGAVKVLELAPAIAPETKVVHVLFFYLASASILGDTP
jgi:hypothetical protein